MRGTQAIPIALNPFALSIFSDVRFITYTMACLKILMEGDAMIKKLTDYSSMPTYFRYWGKACPVNGSGLSYHPLMYHSLDVAAVGRELICHYRPCAKLSENISMSTETFADIFTFFLALHDLGKFASSFQSLVSGLPEHLVGQGNNQKYKKKDYEVRHDTLGYLLWKEALRKPCLSELDWNISPQNKGCIEEVFQQWIQIVTGHHGMPPHEPEDTYKNKIERYFNEEDISAAIDFLFAIRKLPFFPKKLPDLFFDEAFAEILKLSSWMLNGVAILADWMGSDQNIFHYCEDSMSLEEYWHEHSVKKAQKALEKANLKYRIEPQPFSNVNSLFSGIETLTPLQKYCSEVGLYSGPQLFILEDVTGSGKTEAAFILAQRMMGLGQAEGVYIGLPTMATANAMYSRIDAIYKKLFSPDSQPSLILSHSKSRLMLQPMDINYKPDEDTASHWCNRWFKDNRKKALLADVGVGTLDQALLSVLPVRHQALRQLGLANKILIADEIHAYDEYTGTLLEGLLELHARQGGSVILLSATIPQKLRRKLVKAFHKGLKVRMDNYSVSEDFPLATHVGEIAQKEHKLLTRKSCERKITVQMFAEEAAVYQQIQEAVSEGKCVCWIRNTVKDAINSYKMVSEQMGSSAHNVRLFHSRFAMVDRLRIEGEVLEFFGRSSTGNHRAGQVLIATQVVEQSLDLDFDVLISDLAPIDLLIQRAGRLHRHRRDLSGNCVGDEQTTSLRMSPIFYVYGPPLTQAPDSNWLKKILPGTQAIYQNVGQLWLTQQLLVEHGGFEMPGQARLMIESVFGDLQKPIPAALEKLSNTAEGKQHSDRSQATFNRVDLSMGYCWESANHGGWSEEINTPTRLGDSMVEVILAVAAEGELRLYAKGESLPCDMSALSLRATDQGKLKNISAPMLPQIEALKKQYPQIKNYSIVVSLVPNEAGNGYFIYQEKNQLAASYNPRLGFQFEPGDS